MSKTKPTKKDFQEAGNEILQHFATFLGDLMRNEAKIQGAVDFVQTPPGFIEDRENRFVIMTMPPRQDRTAAQEGVIWPYEEALYAVERSLKDFSLITFRENDMWHYSVALPTNSEELRAINTFIAESSRTLTDTITKKKVGEQRALDDALKIHNDALSPIIARMGGLLDKKKKAALVTELFDEIKGQCGFMPGQEPSTDPQDSEEKPLIYTVDHTLLPTDPVRRFEQNCIIFFSMLEPYAKRRQQEGAMQVDKGPLVYTIKIPPTEKAMNSAIQFFTKALHSMIQSSYEDNIEPRHKALAARQESLGICAAFSTAHALRNLKYLHLYTM